jgi:ABC-2 type transport system permease protein
MTTGSETRVDTGDVVRRAPAPGPRTGWWPATTAVYAAQLSRSRIARGPLLFVATLQSLGILVLLRGVVEDHDAGTGSAIVAGSAVLVVAFVALNLLAQRFGAMKAVGALDYYAALPVPPGAVVLGTAASYATFTLPGAVLTAVVGAAIYDLPMAQLWIVVPAVLAAGVALSGVGAALGLAFDRSELATVAGQLAMTAVLFLGVVPPDHLPGFLRALRQAVPSTYAVDALAQALRDEATVWAVVWRVAAAVAWGVVALLVATRLFRRAVDR